MGIKLKAKTNVDEVLKALGTYLQEVQDVAIPIALNKLGDQARVAGERVIRKRYGLTIEQFSKYIRVDLADINTRTYTITATGKGFPLILFKPRQTAKGVTFAIGGRRVLFPHAFIIKATGMVWARGTYGGGKGYGAQGSGRAKRKRPLSSTGRPIDLTGRDRIGRESGSIFRSTGESFGKFHFGANRFPISVLRTVSPPQALLNTEVVDTMNARIEEQAGKVLKAAIKFATRSTR